MVTYKRKPFQGVLNIIRFNWPFYAGVLLLPVLLFVFRGMVSANTAVLLVLATAAALLAAIVSLLVSMYVYDLSGLYRFRWMDQLRAGPDQTIWNIHAGFDETSAIIRGKFPEARLQVFDFYDPQLHTEASVRRARAKYPAYPGTVSCTTAEAPPGNPPSLLFLVFAAHEIRDPAERTRFLRLLGQSMVPGGKMIVVEHLRDLPNFLAYNIGFLHFYSTRQWRQSFREAGLLAGPEERITPFIRKFELYADGTPS